MRRSENQAHEATPTELLLRRIAFHESLTNVQSATVFVFACLSAFSIFLPLGPVRQLTLNPQSAILLAGCVAVIFFAGLYAMQRATAWRVGSEAHSLIQRNRTNLTEIERILKSRVDGVDEPSGRSDKR